MLKWPHYKVQVCLLLYLHRISVCCCTYTEYLFVAVPAQNMCESDEIYTVGLKQRCLKFTKWKRRADFMGEVCSVRRVFSALASVTLRCYIKVSRYGLRCHAMSYGVTLRCYIKVSCYGVTLRCHVTVSHYGVTLWVTVSRYGVMLLCHITVTRYGDTLRCHITVSRNDVTLRCHVKVSCYCVTLRCYVTVSC